MQTEHLFFLNRGVRDTLNWWLFDFEASVSGVNYLVRSATTMMAGWVVLLFTLSSLLKLLLSSVAFPL